VRAGVAEKVSGDDAYYPNQIAGVIYGPNYLKEHRDLGLWFMRAFIRGQLCYGDTRRDAKRVAGRLLGGAPHPGDGERFFYKCVALMRDFRDIPRDAMQAIGAPALIICGDADVVRPEHAIDQYRLIPQSQLAVLPGTDHMHVTARTQSLVPTIGQFLK